MANFHVLFSGEIAEGSKAESVMLGLQRTLGIDARKAKQLFSGRTVVLKSQLSAAEAQSLVAILTALGAICRVKDYTTRSTTPSHFRFDEPGRDPTVRDLTAAHIECPRCGHLQLLADFCAKCGLDIEQAQKKRRKEDVLIEKRLKALRDTKPSRTPQTPDPSQEKAAKTEPVTKMGSWFRKAR